MDVTQTLHNLLEELDFRDSPEYVSEDTEKMRAQDRHFFEWGRDKMEAEGIILQRIPVSGSSFPLAYFRRLEDDSPSNIAKAHKLAWNMGRAPLLFIVGSGKVLVHSTYERPRPRGRDGPLDAKAGLIDTIDLIADVEQARQILKRYKREELLSGRFWERADMRERFNPNTRVERNLLSNLHAMRSGLVGLGGLDPQTIHRLLGRAIFIQYLWDRKDTNERNVFPEGYFERFLSGAKAFSDILADKGATYSLFEALEEKFNGDIFPVTPDEQRDVKSDHLRLLAQFLRGEIEIGNRQLSFWPYYSFDAIPIEFISNMYEEFFHYEKEEREKTETGQGRKQRSGTYYTPQRLVEFVLDEVLPWEGTNTDVRILDPACGSGIFLVECYRRLVSHWCQANPRVKIDSASLKKLMVSNLHGVDQNPEAVQVAAFSLYLTMCDYLDPRYIWANVKFPALRETNLWDRDFFDFVGAPPKNAGSFDLIVGNPPWESQLSEHADSYVKKRSLPVGDKQIAQAFLWAAPELCDKKGKVCLIAPSKGLLFNASGPNRKFRKKFLKTFKVNTIVNFASLRKNLFAKGVGPAAPVIYEPTQPSEDHGIVYCCPKPMNSPEDAWHYVIEKHDVSRIPWAEAVEQEHIWKAAMWGGPRDWELIGKLAKLPSLRQVTDERGWVDGEGFIVGTGGDEAEWLTGKPYVAADALEAFIMDEAALPPLTEIHFYRAARKNKGIFKGPHVLVGQSPKAGQGFVAALLERDAVFSQSLLGIAGRKGEEGQLGSICACFATNICTYFAVMTSSRWLVERDELAKEELMQFPLPDQLKEGSLEISFGQLREATNDERARKGLIRLITKAYGLSAVDLALISDAVTYTLDYFRLGGDSEAAKPVRLELLRKYADLFCGILKESFGIDKKENPSSWLYVGDGPMIVLEVQLSPSKGQRRIEMCTTNSELSDALKRIDRVLLEERSVGVYVRRDVHVYTKDRVYIAKRNQQRLWTQSVAIREADEIYAEIMRTWGQQAWK